MDYYIDDNFESTDSNSNNSNHDNTDSDNQNSFQHFPPKKLPPSFVFATFARSLGIFSIFCAAFSIFFGAFICGGLAIILAFLSKGYDTKMVRNAKIGLISGIVGVVIQISVLGISVYNIITVPEYREKFNSLYEQMYGVPVDESITDILDQLGVSDTEGGIL